MGSRIACCFFISVLLPGPVSLPLIAQQASEAPRHEAAGRRQLEKRDWKAAATEFEAAIRLDPKQPAPYIGLGVALWNLNDREGAFKAFQHASEADPKSADAHYNIAIALKELGENAKAADALRTALKFKPDHEQAELALAVLLQQSGEADRAIAMYRGLLKRNPRSADAHNWLGVALLQKNQLRPAAAEFREAIRLKPDYVRAYNNLGTTLAQGGDVEEGIQALQQGLKHAPDDLRLRLNLGMALRSKGDAEAALALFKSLAAEHSDPELLYQYGQTLRQAGDLGPAIRAFEQSLELSPEARETYYGLGLALKELAATAGGRRPAATPSEPLKLARQATERGELQQARTILQQAVAAEPESAEAHNLLGFVLGRQGELAAAIEKLKKAVSLDSALADAHYNLGVALWYAGERSASALELDEALRLNPAAAAACSFRGMMYRETGDLPHARKMFARTIALDSSSPLPYFDLGRVFLRLGELQHAVGQFEAGLNHPALGRIPDLDVTIAELRRALSGKPQEAEAYNVLGRLLGAAGVEAQQVIAAFEEAIRLRPDYAEARNNLGLVYVQTGDDAKAAAAFREAIRLRSNYAEARQNLGALLIASDASEAVSQLEKAVALQPGFLKAQFNLAMAYEASPEHGPSKGIEQLKMVIAKEPKYPRAEFILGRMLLRHGKTSDAIEHLNRAVSQEPEFGEARYQLGLALSRSGRAAEGAAEIKKSRELITAAESEQTAQLDLSEAKAALERGEIEPAISKLRRLIAFRPAAAEPHYLLGTALNRKGERQEAAAMFNKALELDPRHPGAKAALAAGDSTEIQTWEGYIREGKFEQVEPLLRTYLEKHPDSAWGWYALGYSLYGQRKIGESIAALSQSLQLDVKNPDAHKILGRNLMIIGRFDAAKIEFEQGARLDPKSAEMPYNLGKLYAIQDNWAEAKRYFGAAVGLDPSFMEAHDGLGLALESLGDDAGATTSYKRSIELCESRKAPYASPYVNMSALLNRTGDRDGAFDYARRALQANSNSDRALFQIAKVHEYRGELDQAADALNRAIAINPRASSYFYVLAAVYRKLGKPDDSRAAMATFSKLERESNELEQKRRDWIREGARE